MSDTSYLTLSPDLSEVKVDRPVDVGGSANAGKIVKLDHRGYLSLSLLGFAVGEDVGILCPVDSSGLTAGDWVRIYGFGASPVAGKASSLYTEGTVGFVKNSYAPGEIASIYTKGENSKGLVTGALAAHIGKPVFLSSVAGKLSVVPPTGANNVIQPVGILTNILPESSVVTLRFEFRILL